MQIAPVCFRIPDKINNIVNNNTATNPLIKPKYNNTLQKDTVSFGIKYNTVADSVWRTFSKDLPTLRRIAVPFLDTAEAVARQHQDSGVSFVREMFERTAVKGADEKLSKALRAKTLEDRDAIRTTMFVKNPYDLSITFDKIIPSFGPEGGRNYLVAPISTSIGSMMERGYVPFEEQNLIMKLSELPNTKEAYQKYLKGIEKIKYDYYGVKRPLYDTGDFRRILLEYLKTGKKPEKTADMVELIKSLKKEIPDIDVRLDPKMVDAKALSDDRKLFLGKPHGKYEDIQIRFIRECDKSVVNPIYHELLIQFGPNYHMNAVKEHQIVYEPLRILAELRIPKVESFNNPAVDVTRPEIVVSRAIGELEEAFGRRVSDWLFSNGKSLDFYNNAASQERIFFSESSKNRVEEIFEEISKSIDRYYKKAQSTTNNYYEKKQLRNDALADKAKLALAKNRLKNTIKHVNMEYEMSNNSASLM